MKIANSFQINNRPIVPFAHSEVDRTSSTPGRAAGKHPPPASLRLGHVHLEVRALDDSLPFYTGLLGLRLVERVGCYAFLAIGNEHHSVALEEIGAWAIDRPRRAVGVAHVAFEVPGAEAFQRMRRKLSGAGVPLITRNNGISWTMRFKDPDRNEIEIYADRRSCPGGASLWRGRWRGPLEIKEEAAPIVPAVA